MNRRALTLGAAILAISATPAAATQQDKQIAKLQRQVAHLGRSIKALQVDAASTNVLLACLSATGVGQFGQSTTTDGYSYTGLDGVAFLTTALDFDASPTPTAWLVQVDPACVTTTTGSAPRRGTLPRHHAPRAAGRAKR